jgi:tetratricopeptide (TPR) repeat protein
LIEDDPELAYQHAKTARRLAARLGGVREAVAVTAYLSEHYDEALTEFRAVRRMTGNQEVLPTMADCERALGRPEKALALSREKQVKDLEPGSQIEMLIVAAGARRDMGQTAAAIQTLEVPELTKRTRAEWLPRLRYAYADALQEAGRTDEALVWFHRAAGVDGDGVTGAAERAAELEGLQFTDLDDEEDEDGEYVDGPIVDDALDGQLDSEDEVDAPAANDIGPAHEVDAEAGAGLESDDEVPADLESDDEAGAGLESDDDELNVDQPDDELGDDVDDKPQD